LIFFCHYWPPSLGRPETVPFFRLAHPTLFFARLLTLFLPVELLSGIPFFVSRSGRISRSFKRIPPRMAFPPFGCTLARPSPTFSERPQPLGSISTWFFFGVGVFRFISGLPPFLWLILHSPFLFSFLLQRRSSFRQLSTLWASMMDGEFFFFHPNRMSIFYSPPFFLSPDCFLGDFFSFQVFQFFFFRPF